jgi:hypothetical protein
LSPHCLPDAASVVDTAAPSRPGATAASRRKADLEHWTSLSQCFAATRIHALMLASFLPSAAYCSSALQHPLARQAVLRRPEVKLQDGVLPTSITSSSCTSVDSLSSETSRSITNSSVCCWAFQCACMPYECAPTNLSSSTQLELFMPHCCYHSVIQ